MENFFFKWTPVTKGCFEIFNYYGCFLESSFFENHWTYWNLVTYIFIYLSFIYLFSLGIHSECCRMLMHTSWTTRLLQKTPSMCVQCNYRRQTRSDTVNAIMLSICIIIQIYKLNMIYYFKDYIHIFYMRKYKSCVFVLLTHV